MLISFLNLFIGESNRSTGKYASELATAIEAVHMGSSPIFPCYGYKNEASNDTPTAYREFRLTNCLVCFPLVMVVALI